ncbi:MAG: rhodanese-related sulfurtransferase [Marivirga sp.]|jgi:rhodanese-related sulfurtransferase
MMKRLMQVSFLSLLNLLGACGQQTYDQKLNSLYKKTVPLMRSAELDSMREKHAVVLLDTRSTKEYQVSHLKDAQFVDYDAFEVGTINIQDKEKPIVVYCSVGYRSERVGEALKKAGYKNVYNLYGGIFQWKNEDYPVYGNDGKQTDSVHTYNKRWGQWLEEGKGIKVYD